MMANPLTYGLAGLRRALYLNDIGLAGGSAGLPSLMASAGAMLAFALLMFAAASAIARRTLPADLH